MIIKSDALSCLLWPFVALGQLTSSCLGTIFRLMAVLLGFFLIVAGLVISFTIVGLVIGIPMIILGVLLMARGVL